MFIVVISEKGGATRQLSFDKPEVTIGRVQGNDIILPKGNVSKRHARVVLKDGRFIVVDLKSTNGTYVNGRKITSPLVVKSGDKIYVGDFALTLEQSTISVGGENMMPEPDEALAPPAPPPLPSLGGPQPFGGRTVDADGNDPSQNEPSMSGSESVPSSRFALDQEPPPSQNDSAAPPSFPGVDSPSADEALGDAVASMDALPPISNPPPLPPPSPFLPPTPEVLRPSLPPPDPMPAMPSAPPAFAPTPPPAPSMAGPVGGGPIVSGGFGAAPGRDMTPPPASSPGLFGAKGSAGSSPGALPASPPRPPAAPPRGLDGGAKSLEQTGSSQVSSPQLSSSQVSAPQNTARTTGAARSQSLNMQTTTGMRGARVAIQALIGQVNTRFDGSDTSVAALHDAERRQHAEATVNAVADEMSAAGELQGVNFEMVKEAVLREVIGLGALEPLLAESTVREVVVEGPGQVLADHGAGLKPTGLVFSSSAQLTTIALRLIAQAGGEVTGRDPMIRVTLPYGPQVTVVLPPVAVRGPIIEIRRMAPNVSADDLVDMGMMNNEMLELLRTAVQARRNIIVVGPAGSGVTSVLGATAGFIDNSQRIVTVEEVPDLPIDRDHVISLACGNRTGGPRLGEVVRQAAQLRSDRLVIDDVRGGELFDVFSVLSARRPGNLVGVHAETEQALSHLPALVRRGSALSQEDAAQLTSQVVHLLVALDVDTEGKGRVSRIVEMNVRAGERTVKDLWAFEDGKFASKGAPSFSG
jgi:pilus assembly protein CpaF